MQLASKPRLRGVLNSLQRCSRTILATAASCIVLTLPAGPANANLLINPGFEIGDFTGWSQSGDIAFTGVQCFGGLSVHEGNCSAYFTTLGSVSILSQTVATMPGTPYHVDFWVAFDGGAPSSFSAMFGDTTLVNMTNPIADALTFSFTGLIATSTSTLLTLTIRDDPGFIFVDAVNVAVPEPASMALLGLGLAALPLTRRRSGARLKPSR